MGMIAKRRGSKANDQPREGGAAPRRPNNPLLLFLGASTSWICALARNLLANAWTALSDPSPTHRVAVWVSNKKRVGRPQQHRALGLMADREWEEAFARWHDPVFDRVGGEQQQLPHAGRTLMRWITSPKTIPPQPRQKPAGRVSVFSALTNHHDLSWPAGYILPDAKYTRFTDRTELEDWNTWHHRAIEYTAGTPTRSARWVKTHPHILFPNSRWAIWLDANVIPLRGLDELFSQFQQSHAPMAAIPHPLRETIEEETQACITRKKDDALTLENQLKRLGPDPGEGLWETNVCFFDLSHPKLATLLTKWWSLMESGSHRDQIVLPHAIRESGAQIYSLLPQGQSTRSDPRFLLIPHRHEAFTQAHQALLQIRHELIAAHGQNPTPSGGGIITNA